MKARRKGDTAPFGDVYEIVIGRGLNAKYIPINEVEFEQEPNQLNPEEEKLRHWETIRQQAAIAAMHAFCVSPSSYTGNIPLDKMAQHVVEVADVLVKKLKGE